MTARIGGLAIAAALAAPVSLAQAWTASAATAQFFVTGYVLLGYTASGTYVHPGTCAVDPRVIPLGSYITIAGLGTCHAEDTGGLIIGYRIDVWVATVAQAYALTGWYTAAWGPSPTPQALGSHAFQPQPPAPTRRLVPPGQARLGHAYHQHAYHQPEYSHGNAYVHQPQLGYSHGTPYVHRETRAHARHIVAPPTDALISHLPVTGCPAGRGTTMVARVGACTRAPLPVRHHIQQGRGLYEGASRTRVDSPRARAREHEAHVHSAEQAHLDLDLERLVFSTMGERGMPRSASGGGGGGSALRIARPVAATGVGVPPIWPLAITMVAVVAAWLRRHR